MSNRDRDRDRERDRERDKKNTGQSSKSAPARQSQFFINGAGIDREVITTDICRYLGNDALVRPGSHQDPKTGQMQEGFYITAYRPPTSAQLADLRADSLKWQEERRKNTARNPGGYNESATRQAAIGGGNLDDRQQVLGTYSSTPYAQPPQTQQAMPTRQEGYAPRVEYRTTMPPPAPPAGSYRNTGMYPPQEQNYVYSTQTREGYSAIGENRDRMETTPTQPPWNMPPSAGYQPPGVAPVGANYPPGRPTYNYSPVGANQPMQPGYGRADPQVNYNDPYGPRDSGVPPTEPQEYGYANDEEIMDYEEPTAPTTAPAPVRQQRERERDSRERHEEPTKRRHGHRS